MLVQPATGVTMIVMPFVRLLTAPSTVATTGIVATPPLMVALKVVRAVTSAVGSRTCEPAGMTVPFVPATEIVPVAATAPCLRSPLNAAIASSCAPTA